MSDMQGALDVDGGRSPEYCSKYNIMDLVSEMKVVKEY